MENKLCTFCDVSKPLEEFSKRDNKPVSWCKVCVSEKTKIWYQNNKERALLNSKNWSIRNRRKSNKIKYRWVQNHKDWRRGYDKSYREKNKKRLAERARIWKKEHPEIRREITRSYYLRKKLDLWLHETGEKIIKALTNSTCSICGMETRKKDIYIFHEKYTCADCLLDYKQTSFVPRKTLIVKVECPECGRLHCDKRFENVCIDCRIRKRTLTFQRMFV